MDWQQEWCHHEWQPFLSMRERYTSAVSEGPIETLGLVKVCRFCRKQETL
jgi:hypothetical protein